MTLRYPRIVARTRPETGGPQVTKTLGCQTPAEMFSQTVASTG